MQYPICYCTIINIIVALLVTKRHTKQHVKKKTTTNTTDKHNKELGTVQPIPSIFHLNNNTRTEKAFWTIRTRTKKMKKNVCQYLRKRE